MTTMIMTLITLYIAVYGMIRINAKESFLKQIRKCLIGGSVISLVLHLSMFIFIFFYGLYEFIFLNKKSEIDIDSINILFPILFSTLLLVVGLLMKIIEGQKDEK
jgi:hypothetical protein